MKKYSLYFFIDAQIAQVVESVVFKWAGQLRQSGQQYRNAVIVRHLERNPVILTPTPPTALLTCLNNIYTALLILTTSFPMFSFMHTFDTFQELLSFPLFPPHTFSSLTIKQRVAPRSGRYGNQCISTFDVRSRFGNFLISWCFF